MSRIEETDHAGQGRMSLHWPWGPLLGGMMFATVIASILWLHRSQTPFVGGPFELINAATGRQVSDQDFRGKWLLVFFGYTHCPDLCPTTLSNIAESITQLGRLAARVQPLFITVDPERDTQQVLVDYTGAFDHRIVGLFGSAGQVAAAARAYRVYYAKRMIGDEYYMDHTGTIYAVRPDGTYATSFLSTAGSSEIAKSLRQLIGNDGK